MRHLVFVRYTILLVAALFVSTLPPIASIDILSVYPSAIYAGSPAQLQLQVDLSAMSIPAITQSAIGPHHTCARTTLGALYCWGRGDSGQVGNGRNDLVNSRPILVVHSGVVSVAAGQFFSCFLTVNSSVLCFGNNKYGQLGDGTSVNRNTPVPVTGLQSNVVAISCGSFHACALNSTGTVLCWGNNEYAQLGDGTVSRRPFPTPAVQLPHIVAIGLANLHTCALSSAPTSQLFCWGWNRLGSLGVGDNVDSMVPVAVVGLGPVSLFALNGGTTCATNSSGVYCWGWNSAGQVGDGTYHDRVLPSKVQHSGMGTVRELSVGMFHACAIDVANVLWCWGQHMPVDADVNVHTATYFTSLAEPAKSSVASVPMPSKSQSLACGHMNTCVTSLLNRTLLCWGTNSFGQVGDGTTLDTLIPISVFEICSSPAVGSMSSGLTCSWSESVFTLRVGSTSQLSTLGAQDISFYVGPYQFSSRNASSQLSVLAPRALTSIVPSVVFSSSSSALVLTVAGLGFGSEGGHVTLGRIGTFTDGLNFTVVSDTAVTVRVDVGSAISVASAAALDVEFFVNGALFRSGVGSSRLVVKSSLVVVSPSSVYTATKGSLRFASDEGFGVLSSSMGQTHACAVMVGGLLFCWGNGDDGKLGSATGARTLSSPVSGFADPVLLVSAGTKHTCVITVKRDAFCLGSNTYGQLGDGTLTLSSRPVLVEGGFKWLHLHSSDHITCGVTITGAVYCWGRDWYGLGGSGSFVTTSRRFPNAVLTLNSGFQSVSCARWACCALRVDGQLWCWGNSNNGELGQDNDEAWAVPVKVSLPGSIESNFTSVAAGQLHFCAISTKFQVWCWGLNTDSQCGKPSDAGSQLPSPTLVPNMPAFVSYVTAGNQHSCAGNSSVLFCWGSNPYGQLGDGSAMTSHHPPSIVLLPLIASETIVSVSSNRGWTSSVVTSFNRLFVWGKNDDYQLGDGSNGIAGVPVSDLFPVSVLQIGASSDFDSLTWIGRSTFSVQFNSRSFPNPSNGSLLIGFLLGPFAFMSSSSSSQVSVLAPRALTSIVPSVVFSSSSSALVLTVAGLGFGSEGGHVTLGRIGTFTDGLNFTVVSDTAVTVRVDVGSAISVASAAALDVEFFVNGALFRSGVGSSRLVVKSSLVVVSPSSVYTATKGSLRFASDEGFGVLSSSMGQTHACAVMVGGLLFCWGNGDDGKLGSATGARTLSSPVSGFADPVLLVSAGTKHTCVITVKRDAFCLGSNTYGQLGDGTLTLSSRPVLVEGGFKWLHLHSSDHITCGVTITGAVYCWGRDEKGQAGSGGIVNANRRFPNAVLTLNSGFQSVSCARWACCALRVDGQLWCWGNADRGELGQGDIIGSGVPVKVSLPGSIESNFTSVAAGQLHFCAISTKFQVWCWGLNTDSQCGKPSDAGSQLPSPTLVPNMPAFVSYVTAGNQHSCAGNSSVLFCWGSNPYGQLGDGSAMTSHHPPSIVLLPLIASETIVSVSSNRGWTSSVVTSFNRLFVWGKNDDYQLGDGSNGIAGVPVSDLFPVSVLQIGASSDFDSLTWIGRSTFSVQFNSRSFPNPSNGSLLIGFLLGPFAFMSSSSSSQVSVLAPRALTSIVPSVVFSSSSSALVLTVAGLGFGSEGGHVTLGRIGTFTDGLNFTVVSDTAVTVRVDVGSAISVASAAALDVEFFVNGALFRSLSPQSRLAVSDPVDRLHPPDIFAHNLLGGVFLTVFGNQFGPAGGHVSEGRIGALSQDLTFSVAQFNSSSALGAHQLMASMKLSGIRNGLISSVVLVSIKPSSSVAEQLLGRPLIVEFVVNSKRFRSSSSTSLAVALQILGVHPTSIFASRVATLTLQVDRFGQLQNNVMQCSDVMIGSVVLSLPCVWITNTTVRVSVSASDGIVFNSAAQSVQFWDGAKMFKSTGNSRVLVLPYQEDVVNSPTEAPSNLLTYLLSFGISLGVLLVVFVAFYIKQRAARQRLEDKLASQTDSSYECQVRVIDPSKVTFAESEASRAGFFGSIRKAVWSAAPGIDVAVAVKQRNSKRCQEWDMERFDKAVQDWVDLRHPHCIRLLGYCTQAENILITMEWLQKGSLADVLETGEAVPPHARLRMARELSQGLAFLHANGMTHGSIKNRNILMAQDGTVKLGDRSFAEMQRFCSFQPRVSDAISVVIDNAAHGVDDLCAALAADSVAFMAPEVLGKMNHLSYQDMVTGSCVSAKTDDSLIETSATHSQNESAHASAPQDVFALGVVMWSLLAWKKPFNGMSELDVKHAIVAGANLPPVSPLPKGITSDYVEVMNLCLSKDPSLRPTAELLSERLIAIDPSTRPVLPIDLMPPGFISDKAALLDCVVVAMPNERDKLEFMVKKIVHFHSTDTDAIRCISECGLTKLEAQSISFYTFSVDNGFEWQDSPFFIYNKAVRMLDHKSIATWHDFSYYFTSALKKLPSIQRDVFRGLDLRLTQMSHLYQEDSFVGYLPCSSLNSIVV
jgi:alpha-tubulin suppressor-like RCC1 family protein/serine/threonine protein kinase